MIRDVWEEAIAEHGLLRVTVAVLLAPLYVLGLWFLAVAYIVAGQP